MTSHISFRKLTVWRRLTGLLTQERLEFYLETNKKGDNKRQAILLSACGALTSRIVATQKLNEVSYKDIVKLVADNLSPKLSEVSK